MPQLNRTKLADIAPTITRPSMVAAFMTIPMTPDSYARDRNDEPSL